MKYESIVAVIWTPVMGSRLTVARQAMQIGQKELGERMGVSQGLVSRIERGRVGLAADFTLKTLREALESHTNFVLFGTGAGKYNRKKIGVDYWKSRFEHRGPNQFQRYLEESKKGFVEDAKRHREKYGKPS